MDFSSRTKNGTPAKPFGSNTFQMPSSSPQYSPAVRFGQNQRATVSDEDESELPSNIQDDDMYDDAEGEEDTSAGTPAFKGFTSVNAGNDFKQGSSNFGRPAQSAAPRSRFGASGRKGARIRQHSALPGAGNSSVIPGIARDLAAKSKDATLFESDELIMATEDIVSQATEAVEQRGLLPEVTNDILSRASAECVNLWSSHADSYSEGLLEGGFGPGESSSPISKATFLSSLLLNLHHPPLQQTRTSQVPWSGNRSMAIVPFSAPKATPMPKVLLDWLERYHIDTLRLFDEVYKAEPNVTAHELFWETVASLQLRGKFKEIIQLFHEADFRYAASALDDGEEEPGYRGGQLQSVQNVVARARQTLEVSPIVRHDDWQINNADWSLFRKRVETELEYLKEVAEGSNMNNADQTGLFSADNFGARNTSHSLTLSSRRAQSNVPWTVYQSLTVFYKILLGSSPEIIAQSQDWLEASLTLTIWWDGTQDDDIATWSLSVSRQTAKSAGPALHEDPYLGRLSAAFLSVTDPGLDDTFQINSMSLLEVGLASVLQGNVEGVLGSLKSWSLVIASAVTELGAMGGWVRPTAAPRHAGLDEDDLMVLSYGQENGGITKDDILLKYAEQLFEREELQYQGDVKEGWELAIAIANRLDDQDLAKETISRLLDELHLTSQDRLDKLVMLCTDLGLEEEARNVSERFADHLMSTTSLFGPAMICYARAHSTQKLRTLISLLISYSLVSSVSYPLESRLDPSLSALLHNPRPTLSGIAELDPQAASLLQFHLSGYASLRKFYTFRDADYLPQTTNHPTQPRPLARTRLAAKYLVAVISSAADPVYGGLYDPQRESAVQVDTLLPLLGEASALLSTTNHLGKRIFDKEQIYTLLSAIEDIETVNERVFKASEECFNATLRQFKDQGHGAGSPEQVNLQSMLKKSVSGTGSGSGSGSNFSFSMMGSELLQNSTSGSGLRREGTGTTSGSGSGVLVEGDTGPEKVERGWDWRETFGKHGEDGAVRDVLETLRRGLAGELAAAMLRGGD